MKQQSSLMKKMTKVILTLSLIIVFLVTILFGVVIFGFSFWLRTYRAFTKKKLVAEITTSALMYEEDIPYSEITIKQIDSQSALISMISRRDDSEGNYDEDVQFRGYGDRFEVGGEVVKWNDWLNIVGLDTIYKFSRLEGDYSDIVFERTAEHSAYDMNGGIDSFWRTLQRNEEKYSFLVDTVYSSAALKFVEDEEVVWGLYITEDGFLLDRID